MAARRILPPTTPIELHRSIKANTMSGLRRNKWGDDDDDELPEMKETPVNGEGIKTRTEYKMNGPARVKVTSKVRVITETIRTSKAAAARRARMTKFGNALGVDHDNVTIVDDKNEVYMLDPAASEAEDQGQAANINKAFESFQKKNQLRALERKYQLDMKTRKCRCGFSKSEHDPSALPKPPGAGASPGAAASSAVTPSRIGCITLVRYGPPDESRGRPVGSGHRAVWPRPSTGTSATAGPRMPPGTRRHCAEQFVGVSQRRRCSGLAAWPPCTP